MHYCIRLNVCYDSENPCGGERQKEILACRGARIRRLRIQGIRILPCIWLGLRFAEKMLGKGHIRRSSSCFRRVTSSKKMSTPIPLVYYWCGCHKRGSVQIIPGGASRLQHFEVHSRPPDFQ
jgi:hypothetical protein